MEADGPPTRGLVEVSQDLVRDDHKVVKNGVTADGHGISEEGESRTNEEENDGRMDLLQAQTILHAQHQQQHQPQGPIVRWERFLPRRSLKVLLVENDDSTRHVVSALLRNCSYEGDISYSGTCFVAFLEFMSANNPQLSEHIWFFNFIFDVNLQMSLMFLSLITSFVLYKGLLVHNNQSLLAFSH